ncbi:hypothetical protein NL676_014061 [Syzygium grande]|nr:hypothetical protein NL676_014061 [Syzygium grande]
MASLVSPVYPLFHLPIVRIALFLSSGSITPNRAEITFFLSQEPSSFLSRPSTLFLSPPVGVHTLLLLPPHRLAAPPPAFAPYRAARAAPPLPSSIEHRPLALRHPIRCCKGVNGLEKVRPQSPWLFRGIRSVAPPPPPRPRVSVNSYFFGGVLGGSLFLLAFFGRNLVFCLELGSVVEFREVVGSSAMDVGFGIGRGFYTFLGKVGAVLPYAFSHRRDLRGAEKVFVEMAERDAISWNTIIIAVFSVNGLYEEAFVFFNNINSSTLVMSCFSACHEVISPHKAI